MSVRDKLDRSKEGFGPCMALEEESIKHVFGWLELFPVKTIMTLIYHRIFIDFLKTFLVDNLSDITTSKLRPPAETVHFTTLIAYSTWILCPQRLYIFPYIISPPLSTALSFLELPCFSLFIAIITHATYYKWVSGCSFIIMVVAANHNTNIYVAVNGWAK